MKRPFFYSSILLTIATLMASCSQKPSDKIYVSAAASLTEVLTEWDSVYCKPNGIELVLNFGSSGTLTRQIMSQAPCDVFIPASPENIDTLVACGIVNAEAIKPLAYGQLVLIATLKDSVPALALPCVLPQPTVKVAIGDTLHVPAGQYAVNALRKLGVLGEWSPAFIPAANVKAALRLVESGETEYGFVFLSDALKNPKVKILEILPDSLTGAIIYKASVIGASVKGIALLNRMVQNSELNAIFASHGFTTK